MQVSTENRMSTSIAVTVTIANRKKEAPTKLVSWKLLCDWRRG